MSDTPITGPAAQGIALYDARPFFERALAYGVQHGLIDTVKLDAIATEAPKGIVQIARYFGSEFLRPELERARERIVNLVSLNLEHTSGGDLRRAAEALRDNSLLSRSKGASDMLKALIAMPQSSHFGMNEQQDLGNDEFKTELAKQVLATWSMCSLAEYKAELAERQRVAILIDTALWMANALGMEGEDLEDAGKDAEAVIRTALLVLATKQTQMPDWVAFQKTIAALRKKAATSKTATIAIPIPRELPAEFKVVVDSVRQTVLSDLPKIMGSTVPARTLFGPDSDFAGRYFWMEDIVSLVDDFDRAASATWNKATGGHSDEGSLLTLFLCIASGSAQKTILKPKGALALVRKIRKSGIRQELVEPFILANAPAQYQNDYLELWAGFWDEAETCLLSDHDDSMYDAMALLRRDCNVAAG